MAEIEDAEVLTWPTKPMDENGNELGWDVAVVAIAVVETAAETSTFYRDHVEID